MERSAGVLKIGFDFDGVIAYNPLRVLRLPLNFASRLLFRKKIINYYPSNSATQLLWKAAHKFSLFPAKGFAELKQLLVEEKIEGYLITGRYTLLEDDLKKWLRKHKADKLFKGCFINKQDDPPHQFKERMIKKLKLDCFVEDNWDIVSYLNRSLGNSSSKFKVQSSKLRQTDKQKNTSKASLEPRTHAPKTRPSNARTETSGGGKSSLGLNLERGEAACEIHWIYNIVDRFKPYPKKYSDLQHFLKTLLASEGDSF